MSVSIPWKIWMISFLFLILPLPIDTFDASGFWELFWLFHLVPIFLFAYYISFYGGYISTIISTVIHGVWEYWEYNHDGQFDLYDLRIFITITIVKILVTTAVGFLSNQLKRQQEQIKNVFNNVDATIWFGDRSKHDFLISTGIERLTGLGNQEFVKNPFLWEKFVHPDDKMNACHLKNELFSGKSIKSELRIINTNKEIKWIQISGSPIYDSSSGLYEKFQGVIFDITAQKELERSLRESEEWFSTTLGSIGDGVIATDGLGRITYMNHLSETLTGWKLEKALGRDMKEVFRIVHEETRIPVENPVEKVIRENRICGLANHTVLINKDGSEIPIDDSAAPIRNESGEVIGVVMVFRDVIERKRYEEKIRYYAFHDALTGLPNRRLFNDRLTMALAHAKRNNKPLATMFIDLDHFKIINDTLGHEVGDLLLQEVGTRLTQCVREGDTVSRLGGDEFTIILENINKEEIVQIARRINQKLSEKYKIENHELFSNASIGISMYPDDGQDVDILIKNADMAMYYAKENGKNNYKFFESHMNELAIRKLELDKGLRLALERNEFLLHYQPKVDLKTGLITGVEALLRWKHPQYGFISPSEFIPIAEETGLISEIGDWVLMNACKQVKQWEYEGLPLTRVAVNISLKQFQQKNLVESVEKILKETKLEPQFLELEITESVMQCHKQTSVFLDELKSKGITISIDDFGTGYSSLSYLKRLPISCLKIDKSFMRDIPDDTANAEIVHAILNLAKSLNLYVVAEGVETEEQMRFLKRIYCDEIQGYLLGTPLSGSEFGAKYRTIQEHAIQEVAAGKEI